MSLGDEQAPVPQYCGATRDREHTRRIPFGGKAKPSSDWIGKKKIYAIKKVNPTTFGKQFHKKNAVKHISFCPLASYQRKGKEILQTVNKTLNSSGHFSKTSVAFASRLHRSPPGERICAPNCRNLSSCCVVRDCLGCDNLGLTSSFHNSSKIN